MAKKAVQVIKDLACRAMQVLDEIAALDGTRPLEMVADCFATGWGATLYQLSPDKRRLNVRVLSGSESLPALKQEMHAQRMGTHSKRKLLGRIPCNCWTENNRFEIQEGLRWLRIAISSGM